MLDNFIFFDPSGRSYGKIPSEFLHMIWRRVQDLNLWTRITRHGLASRCITTLPTLHTLSKIIGGNPSLRSLASQAQARRALGTQARRAYCTPIHYVREVTWWALTH